jgi:replicative superfamily II helicase
MCVRLYVNVFVRLDEAAERLPPEMRDVVRAGVAVHHAGIDHAQRNHVEHLFTQNVLRVVWSDTIATARAREAAGRW